MNIVQRILQIQDEDSKYLELLIEAILRVKEEYCSWDYFRYQNKQKGERVFCYELYYQFKSLLCCEDLENMRLDAEIYKILQGREINNLGFNIDVNKNYIVPDLVLHKGQNLANANTQKLIVEVKVKNYEPDELKKTIAKLNFYIDSLNFKYAVFLNVNHEFSTVRNRIRRLLINQNHGIIPQNLNRIIVITYKDRAVRLDTLGAIINP